MSDRRDTIESLVRLGAGTWLRTARWSLDTSVKAGSRMLGWLGAPPSEPPPTLLERGSRLLEESADVHYEQPSHPAYERMLSELAPDEARILRLICAEGPQPAVDVRSGVAFAPGSRLVAQGYSMIGAEAGCRFVDQVPAYLSNLNRLGLIWFSREAVRDRDRYQVLEVQPEVTEALAEAGRLSHVVRRSIRMTPLGEDFCRVALPVETGEFPALRDSAPERSRREPG